MTRKKTGRARAAQDKLTSSLRHQLAGVMAQIRDAQNDKLELASTVASTAALMSKSWTIRYHLAALEHETARQHEKREAAARLMVRASKEADAWAKRLIIARKAIDDDDILGAEVHDKEQSELGMQLKLLVG